ncbi:Uncharacterised protein [Acinetobacter baumannii]|nr:Uncharacterised protein [Acinetobacter baumannii]
MHHVLFSGVETDALKVLVLYGMHLLVIKIMEELVNQIHPTKLLALMVVYCCNRYSKFQSVYMDNM